MNKGDNETISFSEKINTTMPLKRLSDLKPYEHEEKMKQRIDKTIQDDIDTVGGKYIIVTLSLTIINESNVC